MFGRIVLILLLSLLAITSVTGKLVRYLHTQQPVTSVQQGAQEMSALNKIMQRSGFELLYNRKIYNGGNHNMGVYHYGTCNGLLYMTPINPDEAGIIESFARDLSTNVQFIFQGQRYSHYPSMAYFIGNFKQRLFKLLKVKSYQPFYPMVVASVEIGPCHLAQKINWLPKKVHELKT